MQNMNFYSELRGKEAHDMKLLGAKEAYDMQQKERCVWVNGPIIVGAGPSGLATAACLQEEGVSSVILERADCVASLWQHKTYDRLKLHLPKHACELPFFPFPAHFPTYPTKEQFITYLESYAHHFNLRPKFNECVQSASYDKKCGLWTVHTVNNTKSNSGSPTTNHHNGISGCCTKYISRWLVVATGENAEPVVPDIVGMKSFKGTIIHTSAYKNGADYQGKNVLVVGCGNSGMELSCDLCHHSANPFMVVRNTVHVLPREMFGISTFDVGMALLKWLPVKVVDRVLLAVAGIMFGKMERYGLKRPSIGPLELKNRTGKTPVLDQGTLAQIRNGRIKVIPALACLTNCGAKFVDGQEMEFDSVILATGYRSNVPCWLKDRDFFTEEGIPKKVFPNCWKGENGLYSAGFTKRGLSGTAYDARKIAQDIGGLWRSGAN